MATLNQVLCTGQRIAAEIAAAARDDVNILALAVDCGMETENLVNLAIQNQNMSAHHYEKVRYYLGIDCNEVAAPAPDAITNKFWGYPW